MNDDGDITTTLGILGLEHHGKDVYRETKNVLRGSRGVETYSSMVNDNPTVSAMIHAITTLCMQSTITIESEDEEAKLFIEDNLNNLRTPLRDVLQDTLTMTTYGWSVHEMIYKLEDGRVLLDDIQFRDQTTLDGWTIDPATDCVTTFEQSHPATGKLFSIPVHKLLHFTIGDNTSPEGKSLLRSSYKSWYYITHLETQEAIAAERQGASMPVLRVPSAIMLGDASPAEKASLNSLIDSARNIKTDEQAVLVLPSDTNERGDLLYDMTAYTSASMGIDVDKIITRHKIDMMRALMADWLALGTSTASGSYSLSSDKTNMFAMSIGAILTNIETTLNHQLVNPLLEFNGITSQVKLVLGDVEKTDLAALGTYIQQLASSGFITPDDATEEVLRRLVSLPVDKVGL